MVGSSILFLKLFACEINHCRSALLRNCSLRIWSSLETRRWVSLVWQGAAICNSKKQLLIWYSGGTSRCLAQWQGSLRPGVAKQLMVFFWKANTNIPCSKLHLQLAAQPQPQRVCNHVTSHLPTYLTAKINHRGCKCKGIRAGDLLAAQWDFQTDKKLLNFVD